MSNDQAIVVLRKLSQYHRSMADALLPASGVCPNVANAAQGHRTALEALETGIKALEICASAKPVDDALVQRLREAARWN